MAGSARPRAQGRPSRSGDREYPSAVARIGTGERPVARSKARADVRGSLHRSLAKHVSSRLSGGAAELRTAHNLHAHRAKNAPLRAHPVLQSLLLACNGETELGRQIDRLPQSQPGSSGRNVLHHAVDPKPAPVKADLCVPKSGATWFLSTLLHAGFIIVTASNLEWVDPATFRTRHC